MITAVELEIISTSTNLTSSFRFLWTDTTGNITRSKDPSTNPPDITVSEVGVYDSDKNLVIIGKLSKPTKLIEGNTIMAELSIDF